MPSTSTLTNSRSQTLAQDSDVVLTAVKNAAQTAPDPLLRDTAGLAVSIKQLGEIQGDQNSKDAFRGLANDACGLVYAILYHNLTADGTATDKSMVLLSNLPQLRDTLSSIERFAKREVSKHLVMRIITRKAGLKEVQEFREILRYNLRLLGLESNMTIQEHLVTMASHNREILQTIREPNTQGEHNNVGDGNQTPSEQTTQRPSAGQRGVEAEDLRRSDAGTSFRITNTNTTTTTSTINMNSNNDSSVRRGIERSRRGR